MNKKVSLNIEELTCLKTLLEYDDSISILQNECIDYYIVNLEETMDNLLKKITKAYSDQD